MIEMGILIVLVIFLGPPSLVIAGLYVFFIILCTLALLPVRLAIYGLKKLCAGLLMRIKNAR